MSSYPGGDPYGEPQYDPSGHYSYLYAPYYPPAPAPAARPQNDRRWLSALAAVLVVAALVVAGIGLGRSNSSAIAGSGSVGNLEPLNPGGSGAGPSAPSGPSASAPGSGDLPSASARQTVGIVTIVSILSYQRAESAGTGMIISSDGEILTNNHVINGATSITVTDETTGRSYSASVVGTAPTQDIALLKLRNANGLKTAALAASSSSVRIGDAVVGVGNAGGTGRLTAASGKVTALAQSITASDESGQESERLHDLIQIDAPIIAGDSGGPLYDAGGTIIGIDTAASANRSAAKLAYAIPIDNATSVVKQIESGTQTATIHIGLPGFLGITSQATTGGVGVGDVVVDGPADRAGITSGSVITAVDGKAVTTPQALRAILTAKDPGDRVSVSWTGADGSKHTQTVTLTSGPAD